MDEIPWNSAGVLLLCWGEGQTFVFLVHRPQGKKETCLDLIGFELDEVTGLAFVLFPLGEGKGMNIFYN